jgi:hypothetical protein
MAIENGDGNKRKLSLKEVLFSIGSFILAGVLVWFSTLFL